MTPEDLDKSVGFFTQAITLDPAYPQAYAKTSLRPYFYQGLFRRGGPPVGYFPKAKANAVRALQLDENRLLPRTMRWRPSTSFMSGIGPPRKQSAWRAMQ